MGAKTVEKLNATESQLEQLKLQIKEMRALLKRLSKQRSKATRTLATLDRQASELNSSLLQEQGALQENQQAQARQAQKLVELHTEKESAIEQLKQQLRSKYQTGSSSTLKLLLQQESPRELNRLLKYHQYAIASQNEQLKTFNRIMKAIEAHQTALAETERMIEVRKQKLTAQLAELNAVQKKRQNVLTKIKRSEQKKRAQLSSFTKDQQELSAVLALLKLQAAREKLANQSFSAQKGQLHWPVSVKRHWRPNQVKAHKKGIIIPTDHLTPVRAFHVGKVVFSDWLRGYGLLVIIQHSEEYLSLYAYNASIEKEVGDNVSTGDVIALSGNSGQDLTPTKTRKPSQNSSDRDTTGASLYFEIRKAGTPVNPTLWLSKK